MMDAEHEKRLSPEERKRTRYANALANRLTQLVIKDAPFGIGKEEGFWDGMAEVDRAILKHLTLFEAGQISKEMLDTSAAEYLRRFHDLAEEFKARERDEFATQHGKGVRVGA